MSVTAENNKRIAKNTLLLYFRMLFTMGVSLYTSRVVLNTLGVVDFGIYSVVGGIVIMFTFLNSAMSSATQRYITFELGKDNFQRLQQVFNTTVLIHLLISLLIILLAETIGLWFLYTKMVIPVERMTAAVWVYQFSVLSCIVMVMSVPYNAAIIAHEKMSAFAYISVLEVVLKLLIVYLLVIFSVDKLKLYAVLMLLVQGISRFAYSRYCKKHFRETRYRLKWDKKLFKEMTSFAGWNLFGNIAAVAFTQGVNILLNIFFGPAVNAARGIAVQVQNAVNSFSMNFQMALNPQITKAYANHDLDYMHLLIYRSSKFSFFLLFFLSLPILIETETILSFWLKTVPAHTVSFIRLMLCITMIDAMANPLMISAQATGKIRKYQTVIGLILLSIVPLSYVALKYFDYPEIVFMVHLCVVIIAQVVRFRLLSPMLHLSSKNYFKYVLYHIIIVVIGAVLFPLCLFYLLPDNFLGFVAVCTSSILSVGICVFLLGLDIDECNFLKYKIKAIIK